MRLLVLSLSVGAAELCDSDPAPAIQSRALLQKAVKERLYATGVDFTSRPIRHPTYSATDSGQSHIAADKAQGLITELPCGGFFKLNASYSLEATCPQDCPLQADPTSYSDKDFCWATCVAADECAKYNPEAPVADLAQGACRAAAVDGCEVPSADGTDTCVHCGPMRVLKDGQCELAYLWALYALLAVLVLLVLLILAILGDLLLRPVTNEANLEDALDHRSKQKFRTPNYDGTGRHLYPLSTNLCSTIVGGPGLALHFRFQAALICWAAAICIGWVVLAFLVDNDLLVLGTKQFGTAFRNCVLVAWGRETQRRLMWVKESFLAIVYVCSFAGSIFFAILQRRFFSELDQQNDTMKDYALQVVGLPCLEGSERLEEELKANIEAAAAQPVVGVSVCWAYREHKETVHVEMMKALHRPRGQGPTHFRQPEQDMGLFRRVLFRLEQMVLSEGSEQAISEPELRELVGSMRSSSTAFAVFETEKARDEALRRLSSNGLGFRGHSLQVQKAQHEPQGIHWNNIDGVPFNDKLWRLAKGIGSILLCLLGWMIIFYAPYAWSILKFNYEGGRQPGVVYTLAFSLIVCVGNLLMAEICSRVADAMSFEFKDTRENCYMILYLIAIATNVGFDLWTTYFMATQIMVGMDFRTESGVLLADVDNFLEKFESYALQRSMGQQLFEYAWPCTFIVPFVAEPCAVIFLFSRLFMLLIRSHPELKVWECRNWLAAIDLELGRYADCLVNVYLAVLVFFFPGGYTHWIFLYFTAAHAYIYAYDHYKVLRVVPRCTFSSSAVDSCAQVLLAPACGILLVAIIFKMNCLNGSAICYNEYQLLTVCFAGFAAHCVVHIFLLQFFVPLFGAEETKEYRKDARTYGDVAAAEPCSWFSANPMHCLRSKYVYEHSPPCTFFIAGLEHKMEVNESIGCFFKEKDESVEDAKSYFLAVPSFQEVYGFLRS
eukprot:CAMPEP_0181464960 /NCGR_PEP_ID=MMETSP1110-20121109/35704_1 /TAXON_ID=174948 /ORGANISM="Symbiodinium sp., Strain CCMP421" /LENGTH=948 /DNA_ID=CAMNT_0023589715 /DNA_START=43 /DNA_END=2885 /DNA_ORIENTATION=-